MFQPFARHLATRLTGMISGDVFEIAGTVRREAAYVVAKKLDCDPVILRAPAYDEVARAREELEAAGFVSVAFAERRCKSKWYLWL